MFETPRLLIRPPEPRDFDALLALSRDPQVTQYLDRSSDGEEGTWRRLLAQIGHFQVFGTAMMAVEERGSGRFAGQMGFLHMRRGHGPDFDRDPEAGWTLAGWAQGRGYAREGMEALLARLGSRRTVAMIDPANAPSLTLAARLGYTPLREARYGERPVQLLERPAPPA
jgi:RimJ/RimL family protein N-acetyltransferase